MNATFIIGNLTKDVEIKSVGQNGTTKATGTVAVQRRFDKDKSDFFNFKAFGKTGELLGQFKKGQKVALQGRMEIDNVKDEYGNWKTYCNLVVDQITFVEKKQQSPSPYGNDFNMEEFNEQLPF